MIFSRVEIDFSFFDLLVYFTRKRVFGQCDSDGFLQDIVLRQPDEAAERVVAFPTILRKIVARAFAVVTHTNENHTVVIGRLIALHRDSANAIQRIFLYVFHRRNARFERESGLADIAFPANGMPTVQRYVDVAHERVERNIQKRVAVDVVGRRRNNLCILLFSGIRRQINELPERRNALRKLFGGIDHAEKVDSRRNKRDIRVEQLLDFEKRLLAIVVVAFYDSVCLLYQFISIDCLRLWHVFLRYDAVFFYEFHELRHHVALIDFLLR